MPKGIQETALGVLSWRAPDWGSLEAPSFWLLGGWSGASLLRPETLPVTRDYDDLKNCQQMDSVLYLSGHRTCGG